MGLRSWLRRRRLDEADFREEIRAHLALATQERIEDGVDRQTARSAALGAGAGALRRALLAESVVLCGAGAVLGFLLSRPFVACAATLEDVRAQVSARAARVDVLQALGSE